MEWQGSLFIDTCLPFGLWLAQKLFNVMADLLEWIVLHHGVTLLLHYPNDFLTMGQPSSSVCQCNLHLLIEIGCMLGIPLAIEKVDGPATVLNFLVILLDTGSVAALQQTWDPSHYKRTITQVKSKSYPYLAASSKGHLSRSYLC